jgi:hypothetical protein
MNITELAKLLNGRQYREEITDEEAIQAKQSGLVVVYGASDDLMYFAGVIAEELGAYEGKTVYLNENGLLVNDCVDDCPHFEKLKQSARTIKVCWGKYGFDWVYETTIPHATFDIFEDNELYCRGIVFELAKLAL